MPTAFVASYGSGSPVIGILAEYDALPGVSQEALPEKNSSRLRCWPRVRPPPLRRRLHSRRRHPKNWLQATGQKGTLRVYGTPAEEGGSGKVYMVRAGLFNDVDAVMHWHAGDRNAVRLSSSLANISGKFRFRGVAAHAAASPTAAAPPSMGSKR